jgi:hypothetical protein
MENGGPYKGSAGVSFPVENLQILEYRSPLELLSGTSVCTESVIVARQTRTQKDTYSEDERSECSIYSQTVAEPTGFCTTNACCNA